MRRIHTVATAFVASAAMISMGAMSASGSAASQRLRHTGDASSTGRVSGHADRHAPPPSGGLTIVATFDTSITESPDAAEIETGINNAINVLQNHIRTPITVRIAFVSTDSGLGGAATYYGGVPYAKYRADVKRLRTSAYDRQAWGTLPSGPNNPVTGTTGLNVTQPLLRAVGETGPSNDLDSTIYLNTGIMNLSRTGPQDFDKYDLQQVVTHEMAEVLGAGGAGCGLLYNNAGSLDLYRYSGVGLRSYTTDAAAVSYFSINGGNTQRGYFNQDDRGDYGDWDHDRNGYAQVQDAFSTPGVQADLDTNEYIALDVIGYDVAFGH